MARNRTTAGEPTNKIRAELYEILKDENDKLKVRVRNDLREIRDVACDLIAEKLGIDDEYEIVTETENNGDGPSLKSRSSLRPKVQRDRDVYPEISAITTLLDRHNVDLFGAVEIFDAVELQLFQCAVRYVVDKDGKYQQVVSNRNIAKACVRTYHPKELKFGRLHLSLLMSEWFRRKIVSSLPDFLPERRLAIKRLTSRIEGFSESFAVRSAKDCLAKFLKETEQSIHDQVELNADRKKLAGAKGQTEASAEVSSDGAVDELTGRTGNSHKRHSKQTIDRTALFFHYFFNHANAKGKKVDKAEVVHFLTAYSKESLEQKFSGENVYGVEGDGKFLRDLKVVIALFTKLGMAEVVKQIKRDHQELETIR